MNPLIVLSLDGIRAQDIENPALRIPHLRRIIQTGALVRRVETTFPSVTWAIHSSVVTGCHPHKTGIFGNTVFDRRAQKRVSMFDPDHAHFDRDQKAPHLFGALASQGKSVATVCWPLTQGASQVTYNIPEFYQQAAFDTASSPELWAELRAAGLPVERYGDWSASHLLNPLQDSLTADIAGYLLANKKPDALFLHFLLVDSLQHDFGVGTPEAFWAIEFVDGLVGRVLADAEAAFPGHEPQVVVFSDHGHAATTSAFSIDVWLAQQGFGGTADGPFVAASNGGVGYLYNLSASALDQGRLVEELTALEWVEAVWTRPQFPVLGLPDHDVTEGQRLPDVVFEVKSDHVVLTGEGSGIVVGPCQLKSMHGFRPHRPEMQAFLAASGPAFAPGMVVETGRLVDVAPLINEVYGLGMEGMDGAVPWNLIRRPR